MYAADYVDGTGYAFQNITLLTYPRYYTGNYWYDYLKLHIVESSCTTTIETTNYPNNLQATQYVKFGSTLDTKFYLPAFESPCNYTLAVNSSSPSAGLLNVPALDGNIYVITPVDMNAEKEYEFQVDVTN